MFGDPGNKNKPGAPAASPLGGTVPDFPAAFQGKVRQNCAQNDPVGDSTHILFENFAKWTQVCQPSASNILMHLTYIMNPWISGRATFIQTQFQSGTQA